MKRTWFCMAAGCVLALTVVSGAVAQESESKDNLADVARQQRQAKRPSSAKVVTNDDLAMTPAPTPAAPATAAKQGDAGKEDKEAAKADKEDKGKSATPSAEDKAKLEASFKSKALDMKKNIAQLERELDVAQREYRLKVAVYYADVGNNLRDSKKWAEEDRKQRAELEGKQKAIDEAKQKLADLQEEARKAGVRAD